MRPRNGVMGPTVTVTSALLESVSDTASLPHRLSQGQFKPSLPLFSVLFVLLPLVSWVSPRLSILLGGRAMVLVCQTCGVPGYTELLIYCNMCKSSAEHRYCLDILPSYHEEVSWSCDLCKPRPSKVELEILHRSTRKLKCKKIRKRCQITIAAPQFAPPQKQPHYKKSPATVHGQVSIRKSPASLLQKEVDDLSQSFRVQLKDKKLKKRRRLVIPVDDQLDEDIQTNNAEAKYENTLTAPKHDSPQKRQEYVPHSHVHMENNGDSTVNGKWNRPSDSLLQKKVVDLSQSFGIQFERKNLKRRRMILPEDDQLDGDVLNNSAVNERLLEARYENTVIAPKVASPENPHQYITCTHSVQNGTCAGATVKSNRSTNSLLQKEVDDLFQSIRMQSEEKNLRMQRTRLILLEGEQLGQEAQSNNAVNKRLAEVRYEKTVTAIKAASPGKPHQYVYKENHAGPSEDGISNRSTDNLLQKKVVDPFKSFRMQLERKNLRMQSRRLMFLEDDQLDEDVQINNEANEGHLKAEKSVNVSSELSDGRFLKKMRGLPNECLLDEEVHINSTGQNSPISGPLQLHPTLQVEEHTPGRKLICSLASSYEPYNLPAQPIRNHIWRGHFHVCNKELGPFTAHISSKACEKVWNIAKKLPAVLQMTKLSRLDSWPKSFKTSPPNDESIALYFFAQDARVGAMLDELLCEITKKDFVLKVKHDEAELLAFSSIVLPESYRKFQEKYFLWAVFRRRQGAVSCAPAECSPSYDEITEEKEWAPYLTHATKKESDDIAENSIVPNKLVGNSNNSEEKLDECHDRNACLLPSGKQIPLNCEYPSGEQTVSDCEMAQPSNGCKDYHQELFTFNFDHDEGTTNYPMNLFPEQGEDMALTSRIRGSDSLDLKLGYSWSTCDDAHLKDMFNSDSLT
ncbi:unnamed protein product [Musa acuminata var. zebrina]